MDKFHKRKTHKAISEELADWLNPTGAKKVHSLVDKVYKMKNGKMGLVNLVSLIPSIAHTNK